MKYFKPVTRILGHYHQIAIWCVVIGLLLYTAWQFQIIANPQVDNDYLKKQRATTPQKQLKLQTDAVIKIQRLIDHPVDVTPRGLGTDNPFNP